MSPCMVKGTEETNNIDNVMREVVTATTVGRGWSRFPLTVSRLSVPVPRVAHSLHYEPLEQRESGTVRSPRGMSDRDRTVRKEEGSDGSGRSFLCHSAPSSIPTSLRSVVMMRWVKRGEEEPPLSLVAHSLRPSLLARIGPSSLGSS